MTYIGQSLISTFDSVWNRLGEPLSGLSDEDYFCRGSVGRCGGDRTEPGAWMPDAASEPDPAPVTTIAWRLGHTAGMAVGGLHRSPPPSERDGLRAPVAGDRVPGFLKSRLTPRREGLVGLDEAGWLVPLGEDWARTRTPTLWTSRFTCWTKSFTTARKRFAP
jgi:hypothetical protein